jgi:hypothetical protein
MTHIILIDEYLYSRYRELLPLRLFADNHKGMVAAWEFLASLPPREVYYAKILYDKEVTAFLNRNNFPLHTAAAVAADKFETPTMANYRGAKSQIQSSTLVGNIVQSYLTRRLSLAPKAMINEIALFGSSHELVEYHRLLHSEREETSEGQVTAQERGQPALVGSPPARR